MYDITRLGAFKVGGGKTEKIFVGAEYIRGWGYDFCDLGRMRRSEAPSEGKGNLEYIVGNVVASTRERLILPKLQESCPHPRIYPPLHFFSASLKGI